MAGSLHVIREEMIGDVMTVEYVRHIFRVRHERSWSENRSLRDTGRQCDHGRRGGTSNDDLGTIGEVRPEPGEGSVMNVEAPLKNIDHYVVVNGVERRRHIQQHESSDLSAETKGLYNKNQSGFRRNRSCADQIMRLQDDINKAIHTKGHTIGIFIDLEIAYDMIWKDGLLYKLRKLGIENEMYRWIDKLLTDRTIQVKVGNELSDVIRLENGTPQGSVLSPVLFLVMIYLPDPGDEVKLSIFADDCSIWRSGRNLKYDASILQKYFERYQNWCNVWGFRISKSKTTAVVFSKKLAPKEQIELKIDGENISFEKSVKFLGVIFDCKTHLE